jgi:hypothetical protein
MADGQLLLNLTNKTNASPTQATTKSQADWLEISK